jgi:hypothetical protein
MKRVFVTIILSLLLGACSEQDVPVTAPIPELGLEFSVFVEPNDFGGIAVIGAVGNTGTLTVKTRTGQCMGPALLFTFLDPNGEPIQVSCNCGPRLMCPNTSSYPVNPGELIHDARWFQGRIWEGGGSYPAPPGQYTVLVAFEYWTEDRRTSTTLHRSIQFLWSR